MGCFEIDVWLICETELPKIKLIMEHLALCAKTAWLMDLSLSQLAFFSIAKFQMYPPQLSLYVSPHP